MTQSELKELKAIGAELGAAKAEVELLREQVKALKSDANSWQSGYDKGRHDGARHRKSEVQQLRGLLRQATELIKDQDARLDVDMLPAWRALMKDIRAALSQQPEPTDTYTAVEMATAAAQGFRDGQAAVEQAAAQDGPVAKTVPIPADIARAIAWGEHWDVLEAIGSLRCLLADPEGDDDIAFPDSPAQTEQQHPDDAAVDRFAAAMKAKLAAARAKGRGGWDDPNVCSVEFLAQLLVEHLAKGNAGTFEDVANFAMMLHQRGAEPKVLADAARPAQTEQPEQSGLPDVCDGKEQEAFEEFARGERMDMTTHPLHWLFLNEKTDAARQGWKAAIRYCRAALSAQGAGDADS